MLHGSNPDELYLLWGILERVFSVAFLEVSPKLCELALPY